MAKLEGETERPAWWRGRPVAAWRLRLETPDTLTTAPASRRHRQGALRAHRTPVFNEPSSEKQEVMVSVNMLPSDVFMCWFSNCGPGTNSILIARERVRNAHCRAPSQTYRVRSSGRGAQCSNRLPQVLIQAQVPEPLPSHKEAAEIWYLGGDFLGSSTHRTNLNHPYFLHICSLIDLPLFSSLIKAPGLLREEG